MRKNINKKAQEEMVGFAFIIILVAVIMLIFIGFSINRPQLEDVESYEVESFLQAFLQHTTNCEDNLEHLSVQKLISRCISGEICLNKEKSCEVLNTTISEILEESWKVGENRPEKGYKLLINSETEDILDLSKGNKTGNYKGAIQDFTSSRTGNVEINLKIYY